VADFFGVKRSLRAQPDQDHPGRGDAPVGVEDQGLSQTAPKVPGGEHPRDPTLQGAIHGRRGPARRRHALEQVHHHRIRLHLLNSSDPNFHAHGHPSRVCQVRREL